MMLSGIYGQAGMQGITNQMAGMNMGPQQPMGMYTHL